MLQQQQGMPAHRSLKWATNRLRWQRGDDQVMAAIVDFGAAGLLPYMRCCDHACGAGLILLAVENLVTCGRLFVWTP